MLSAKQLSPKLCQLNRPGCPPALLICGDELAVFHGEGAGIDGEGQVVAGHLAAGGIGDVEAVGLDGVGPAGGAGAVGVVDFAAVNVEVAGPENVGQVDEGLVFDLEEGDFLAKVLALGHQAQVGNALDGLF